MDADFIGKAALRRIHDQGVTRKQVGLVIDGTPLEGPNTSFWPINVDGKAVGKVTSAVYSPRLDRNIALALVATECAALGTGVVVDSNIGPRSATVAERPFSDPEEVPGVDIGACGPLGDVLPRSGGYCVAMGIGWLSTAGKANDVRQSSDRRATG